MRKSIRMFLISLLCALQLIIAASFYAYAAPFSLTQGSSTVTLTVAGTGLFELINLPASIALPSVTVDGINTATSTYLIPLEVVDGRGTGAGWNTTITSTQFTDLSSDTLPTTASQITGVSCLLNLSCGTLTTTNTVTYPVTIPAATSAPAAVKFFSAVGNPANGATTLNANAVVTVPANAVNGIYTSTVTISLVSGP